MSPFAIIRGRSIEVARGASIGRGTVLSVRTVKVGEDARIEDTVWVSSGRDRADSAFDIGGFTILMRYSYVNCLAPVTIGEGTGIGGHCLLFTHGYWLSWFRGFPRAVAPITIGRDVWLPWRVFVMPGTTIGSGAVIGANSLVQGEVPPLALAAGSPARVIKHFQGSLPPEQVAQRVHDAVEEFVSQMKELGASADGHRIQATDGRWYQVAIVNSPERLPAAQSLAAETVVVSAVTISAEWRRTAEECGVCWFDVASEERSDRQNALGRELVAHLSGYGARFRRV